MDKSINQAKHNIEFFRLLDKSFKDRYSDWKITVLFYIAIHFVKALATKKGINIGNNHSDIERNINPNASKPLMPITKTAYTNYNKLRRYSQSCRYDGYLEQEVYDEAKNVDLTYCINHLNDLGKYIKDKGIDIDNSQI